MTKQERVILFDFDGVIVPTFDVGFDIARMRQPDVTEDEYRQRFEGNINNPVKQVMGTDLPKPAVIDFWSLYTPRLLERVPVPGMEALIRELAHQYVLVIVSSTLSTSIGMFLEEYQLRDCFAEILGNDVSTSKVEKINSVLQTRQRSISDCVFVTDTLGDLREAAVTGVPSIAVSWGFHDRATLQKGSPRAIVETPTMLQQEIKKYFT